MSTVKFKIMKLQYRYIRDRDPDSRYTYSRSKCRTTGIKWEIPQSIYYDLVLMPCKYCGIRKFETGIGLDRLDTSLGYSLNNVVPCCHFCNIMKNIFPTEMFLTAIKNIYEHTFNRGKRKAPRNIKSKKKV